LDQARDVALLTRTEQTLAELAAAGQRLADGTYGQCQTCHRPIGAERLLARPETAVCVSCAAVAGRRRRG
jgi:predicted CXXCH cytochrome family protein